MKQCVCVNGMECIGTGIGIEAMRGERHRSGNSFFVCVKVGVWIREGGWRLEIASLSSEEEEEARGGWMDGWMDWESVAFPVRQVLGRPWSSLCMYI